MNRHSKTITALGLSLAVMLSLLPSASAAGSYPDAVRIRLNDAETTVDGAPISADTDSAVYLAPGTTIDHYQAEYAALYGSAYGEAADESEWHTAEECARASHIVITEPGTYVISGTLYGQLSVELASKTEAAQAVTLVLDGADITCDIAPAILFVKAYELDPTAYEDDGIRITLEQAQALNGEAAGAKVVIADGSVNNITGSHVAKCYAYTENEDGTLTFIRKNDGSMKKRLKFDGAFYSKVSMSVSGEAQGTGILNITADNEGLNSEQHLFLNGGNINISAGNDGINTNDENGSVTMISGGTLTINAGLGAEGDGIDSNGYLIINGGTVISCAKPASDSGIDADLGSVINGGTVIALGSAMDQVSPSSAQPSMMLTFSAQQKADAVLSVLDEAGGTVLSFSPAADAFLSANARGYGCAILSSPALSVGSTYTVFSGGTQLGYAGLTESSQGHGEFFPGGRPQLPEGAAAPDMPPFEQDENAAPPAGRPENGEPPDGFVPGMPPADGKPDGSRPDAPGFQNAPAGSPQGGSIMQFRLAAMTNVFSGVGVPAAAEEALPFTDVDRTKHAAFYDAIAWSCREGITLGTSGTAFSPDAACTRAQIVTFLWRAAGEPEPESADCPFLDVSADAWYCKAVLWAYQQGITEGAGHALFAPDTVCTRSEAVTLLHRSLNSPTASGAQSFADVPAGSYYAAAVAWAAENGITAGTAADRFSPEAGCTRGQIVTFLYRLQAG